MKRDKKGIVFIALLIMLGSSFFSLPIYADDITISLYNTKSITNSSFTISNMFPGDSVTNKYNLKVSYHDKVNVLFNVDCLNKDNDDNDNLANVANIKVELINDNGNNKVLYDGKVNELKDVSFSLNSNTNKTEELNYEITISLDTSVDNKYQDKELKLDFIWSIEKEDINNLISPNTSYTNNIVLWISLLILSLIMFIFLYKRNNKDVR